MTRDPVYDLRRLDDLARMDTPVHRLHPLAKLLTAIIYLGVVVSFGRYETIRLLPFVFYPLIIFALAELPAGPVLKRLLLVEPFIIGIGILNPLFDNFTIMVGEIAISRGWITFLSIFIKSGLTAATGILLAATTGMDKLAEALRMLGIPKIFVLQLMLTYRYISVLIEEASRMQRAYLLRAPGQKGVKPGAWGSFAGQLLLRTLDRAQRIYQAMALRGFEGEYATGTANPMRKGDFVYILAWSLFFILTRLYNIPVVIGALFGL